MLTLILFVGASCATREFRDPKRAHLHLTIGTDHLNNARYPEALSELSIAVKYDDKNPTIHNNLGIAFFVRKKFSEAEKHLRMAVQLDPNYTEARNNLGRTLIEMNLLDEAIANLHISNKDLKFTSPEQTKSNLGIAYFKKNQFELSRQYLGESLKLRSQHCTTSNYFARSLFELQSYERAAIAFDQAANNCKAENLDEPIYYGGLTYFKLGKKSEALARFEDLISSYPDGQYVELSKKMIGMIKE